MREFPWLVPAVVGLLAAPAARANTMPSQGSPSAPGESRAWLGPNERPLPFENEGQLLEFMRTAPVISAKELSVGITKARRLHLARDGVEVRVVFHDIDRYEQKLKRLPNGRTVMYLRDSFRSQVAAYEVARLLGMTTVPPTVQRRFEGEEGSAQLWIENTVTEERRLAEGIKPPDFNLWNQHHADMRVFDNLINNIDRNQGNILIDSQGVLWLIDHTRSFGRDAALPRPETVSRCSRRLWTAIRGLQLETLQARLGPLLGAPEIRAVMRRRQKLIALIEDKIAERGEEKVLFAYGDPDPGVAVRYE
jgi:hypothetical protein